MTGASPSYIQWLRRHLGPQKTIIVYSAVIPRDGHGRILLQRRTDFNTWGLPGGILEPHEGLLACARRELFEETGLHAGDLRLVGIYTDPRYDTTYPNGDQVQQFSVCFETQITGGELAPDPQESRDLAFFAPDDLPLAEMAGFYCDMIRDAERVGPPSFEPPHAGPELISVTGQMRPSIGHHLYIGAASAAAVVDHTGHLLVVKRRDNGEWSLPAGFINLGENAAHAAVREVLEETGLHIEPQELLGLSAQPRPWVYPNGDQILPVIAVFRARLLGGEACPGLDEVLGIGRMPPDELLAVPTHPNLAALNLAVVEALRQAGNPFVLGSTRQLLRTRIR